jgi:signal peptidase II
MAEPVGESRSDSAGGKSAALAGMRGADLAWRSPMSFVRFLVPAVVGLVADLWLKAWSFPGGVPQQAAGGPPLESGRQPHVPVAVIENFLGFQTTVNYGAVFGIGQGMASFFLIFSILAMGMILAVFLTSRRSHWIVHIALGLITAGALGNLYDRAMFGGVRDMLRFYVTWYPYIFNLADVWLCVGVPLLMLRWLFMKEEKGVGKGEGFPVEGSGNMKHET